MAAGNTTTKRPASHAGAKKNSRPSTKGTKGAKGTPPGKEAAAERPWTIDDAVRGFSQIASRYFGTHESKDMENTTLGEAYVYAQTLKKQKGVRDAKTMAAAGTSAPA
jgi:hypothetical protein